MCQKQTLTLSTDETDTNNENELLKGGFIWTLHIMVHTFSVAGAVKKEEAIVGPDEKINTPQRPTEYLSIEFSLVLTNLR